MMKVTRRGFFGRIGVLAGVAAVAPLVGKGEAIAKVYCKSPGPLAVNANFAKQLWPDVKKWWGAKYDELSS